MAAFSPCQVGSHSLRRSQKFYIADHRYSKDDHGHNGRNQGRIPLQQPRLISTGTVIKESLYIIMVLCMVFNATINNISVFHRFVASDYLFGIFKLIHLILAD
jgi:hypothetical protein